MPALTTKASTLNQPQQWWLWHCAACACRQQCCGVCNQFEPHGAALPIWGRGSQARAGAGMLVVLPSPAGK